MSGARQQRLGLALVVALGALVHHGALDDDFVNWDDDINLYANPNLIHDEIRFGLPWREPYQGMWIPVTYTTWAVLAAVSRERVAPDRWALDPAPFHAAGLALHLASMALVYWLLLRWMARAQRGRSVLAACLGAALFGVHPIQVEAVHWATALKDTLSGFLALACLALVPTAPSRLGWRMPVAWLVFALALCAKPSVVVVPVSWLLIVLARDGRPTRAAWLHFGVLAGLAGTGAIVARAAQPAEAAVASGLGLVERLWICCDSLGFYLGQIVLPEGFCPDYGRKPEWVLAQGLPTLPVLAGVAYAALVGWLALRRRWRAVCLTLLLPVALGPVLGILTFTHQRFSTVTDRYAYLAMLAPAWMLARVVAAPGRVWAAPLAAAFVLLAGRHASLAGEHWSDGTAMWTHVLEVNPASASAWVNLGYQHEQAGRDAEAIAHYERGIAADPAFALPHNNIGNIHFRAGRLEQAARAYGRARRANPSDLHARNNLGVIHFERGELGRAEASYEEVIATNPRFAPAHHNLGRLALALHDAERAQRHFRAALDVDPGFAKVHLGMARILAGSADDDEGARDHLRRALAMEPGDGRLEIEWSNLLERVGRPVDEVRAARLAAWRHGWRQPGFAARLGRGLAAAGEWSLAEEVLRAAVDGDAEALEARLELARLYGQGGRWDDHRELMLATVRSFPRSPDVWHRLALDQLQHGRSEQARALVRSALDLAPDHAPSLLLGQRLGVAPPERPRPWAAGSSWGTR